MSNPDIARLGHATLNPYRVAAGLAGRRLLWDVRPISWSARAKMKRWHNRFAGQKAVILCNGPSLLKVDFELMKGVFTFGLNKINMLFDKTDFRPSSVVVQQEFVFQQNKDFYNETDLPLFLASIGTKYVRDRPNVVFYHESGPRHFARDCNMSQYGGHTVTYTAMQLAFHMGFTEVALVGCDHNFATKGPANMTAVAQGPDLSHFDPNYFAHGSNWVLPDLFQNEVSYHSAREQFEAFGRRLVNATDGGKLELLERQTLRDFIEG
ncbi:hypothetical protein C3941_18020 [Kaistia algarum]|uniref:6-hydroxymethylpterin diphosphokinase MptE-like protein n=1 Tax=Kaistia algarum TaxID=2083279 RepID=UPI000CE7EE16|nr:6-hydroxymethylpterin diphosphokinase MptE-like protein [Kaistia algarum]MCX5515490.1 DUF115 domain-containing protein [Kaistia algarum]PPE78454.1 hypothetical protein C3941_18020 [Kaistia algarum]